MGAAGVGEIDVAVAEDVAVGSGEDVGPGVFDAVFVAVGVSVAGSCVAVAVADGVADGVAVVVFVAVASGGLPPATVHLISLQSL